MASFDSSVLEPGYERAWERVRNSSQTRVLLCRHSIRGSIPVDPDLRDVPLLAEGHELCRRLGARHGWSFDAAWSSPMLRCRDSLTALSLGAGHEPTFVSDDRLGAPGAFINDASGAWESYVRLGKHELVRCLSTDPAQVRGYRSLEDGTSSLLSLFADLEAGTSAIACSHDILMSCLLSWAFERPWLRPDWPDFFEGVVLEFVTMSEAPALRVSYRDEVVVRALHSRAVT